jgi:predicted ester cyclase
MLSWLCRLLEPPGWDELPLFVGSHVRYNGTGIGIDGYRSMLEGDVLAIPDLRFNVADARSSPVACISTAHQWQSSSICP